MIRRPPRSTLFPSTPLFRSESAARLVKQLLAYARRRSPEVRTVELSELAGSLSELLSTALPSGVALQLDLAREPLQDRKSTRLNSSHLVISYAVFCLKKKNN